MANLITCPTRAVLPIIVDMEARDVKRTGTHALSPVNHSSSDNSL